MSLKWDVVELKSIANVTMGQSPKSEFYNDNYEGMPFLQGNKTFGDKYPSFELYTTSIKKVAKKNSVLMSVRAPVGDLNIAIEDICIGRGICGLEMKKGDNEFLYYLLKANISRLINKESGTVFGSINKNDIETFEISLPKDSENQTKILNVLRDLDRKIENCKSINKNLVELIDTIFNYWFLQFEFPNSDNYSYKSHGGEMKYDEELKREIPIDWEVGSLNDIAEYINGLACQKYRPIDENERLPVIKITEMHEGITDKTEFVRSDIDEKHIIDNGDILFSWSATLETMIWTGGKCGLNQHIFKVISKDYGKYYVYKMLSAYIVNFVRMAESRKTTMGHITKDHLLQSKIPLPPKELTYNFDNFVSELFDEYIQNNVVNKELSSLRDFLLPLLMSGQVEFKD